MGTEPKALRPTDDGFMHVELLVVPDCPHQAGATSLLRTTLDELGFEDATIDTTVIDTVEAAQHRGFIGSPTFLVNGTDAFPVPGRRPAVACRLYSNRDGLAGLPDRAQLEQAVIQAVQRGSRGRRA
jgi:glutaredoxin